MKPLYLAIGVFDGVHKGHRHLINSAIKNAKKAKAWSGVLTFHPHPKQVLRLPNAPQLIYPIQQRYWLLKKLGCNYVFIKKFTEAWSHSTPDRFFAYLKRLFPNLVSLHVGEDFRFGYKRTGDINMLETFCKTGNINLHVSPYVKYLGEKICSTRIRETLQKGLIQDANRLLHVPYHCIGCFTQTLQFKHHNELKVKDGIYACQIINKQSKQKIILQVKQKIYSSLSPLKPNFQKTACLLNFKKEL